MLADRVMVLRLMMVMRGRMMVSSCVVMVLAALDVSVPVPFGCPLYASSGVRMPQSEKSSRQRLPGLSGSGIAEPYSHRPRL